MRREAKFRRTSLERQRRKQQFCLRCLDKWNKIEHFHTEIIKNINTAVTWERAKKGHIINNNEHNNDNKNTMGSFPLEDILT